VDNALTRIRKKANEVYIQFKKEEFAPLDKKPQE
jgi:hypothetical protein